jgi:hypothetical protein
MRRSQDVFWCFVVTLVVAVGVGAGDLSWKDRDDSSIRYGRTTLLSGFSVESRGTIEFAADDSDVVRMSPRGFLKIVERSGFSSRELRIEPGADGSPVYRYKHGGERDFDEDARRWYREVLPRVIRESGAGAEARVARILEAEGVEGVLNEIARIDSGSATRIYCLELLDQRRLDPDQLADVARAARRGIASSGDLAEFLIEAADDYLENDSAVEPFFEAARSIASSGDHANVLRNVLERGLVDDPASLVALFRSARRIASSGDRAQVLVEASDAFVEDSEVRNRYFEAIDSIPSSGDHASVLRELLRRETLSAETLAAVLRSARGIASSGDRAGILIAAADRYESDAALREAYFRAANSVPSSGDHAEVLVSVLRHGQIEPEDQIAVLDSARGVASSGDRLRVLLELADQVADEAAVEAYRATARTLASSGDRERALEAIMASRTEPNVRSR